MCVTNSPEQICTRRFVDLLRPGASFTFAPSCKRKILDHIITNRLTPTKWRKNFQDLLVAINIAGLGKTVEGLMRGKVESCPATRRGGYKPGDYRPIRATSITQVGGNVGENNTNRGGNNRGAIATSKTVFVIGSGYGHIVRHMADTDDESELGSTGLHDEEAGESSDDDSSYDDFSDVDDDDDDDNDGDGDDTEDHDNGSGEEDQDPDVEMPDAPTLTLNPSHLHLHWGRHKHQHCHCSHDALGSRSYTRHQGSSTSSSNGGSNSTTRSMLSEEAITSPTPRTPVTPAPRTPATPSPTPTIAARANRALSICSMAPSESASSAPAPRARPEGERLAAAHSKCSGLSTEELFTSIDQAAGAVIGLATWRMAVMAAETDPGLANDLRERIESLLEMVDVMKEVLREKMGGEKEDYCFGGRFWWWMKLNWVEENIRL
ncbi:uncharacterized protein NECHADRAFT_89408 [Fusarium vanettenii 77-13-4]|uniref:Uncharacterized protein n=1 Tax=Fusarium vanettenii (strain ATCC MYA-4622 / CBS 123669 / FGSC 9596 / NRRL 45880 / 77-13-4) TaxID=660122 RepID=C7ZR23_FUSV7|nr:uncharacterized protein NECHADRAFT_89408 [Fusarium vanettenii 77-13-4]EEU33533.1 predicted protein [Fusarium vanettenii 77-13-4]